jgi:hypothetical protein
VGGREDQGTRERDDGREEWEKRLLEKMIDFSSFTELEDS